MSYVLLFVRQLTAAVLGAATEEDTGV